MRSESRLILTGEVGSLREGVKCQGCKGIASRLDHQTSLTLRGGDQWLSSQAFECPRCQVIIFEEEFDEGRFVPPQFRSKNVHCHPDSGTAHPKDNA